MPDARALAEHSPQPSSIALGFFDGFHRGHQAILQAAAADPQLPAVTFTFRNHPASVISSERKPGLLTTADERFAALTEAGSQVVWVDFDRPFSQLSPESFFSDILVNRLGARRLVSGANYRFGHRAQGDVALLRQFAEPHGIEVVTVPGVEDGGELISSTRIRQALQNGDPRAAERMLGRPFRICNRVLRGDQRGRTLGFPTANLPLPVDKLAPAYGVYACRANLQSGESFAAVANLGVRPTVTQSNEPLLEVHLIDFSADLYGEHVKVDLLDFIRPERRFSGLDELKSQIEQDRDRARQLLR